MSDQPRGVDWWQASDGRWYAPELHPARRLPPIPPASSAPVPPPSAPTAVGGSPVLPPIPPASTAPIPPTSIPPIPPIPPITPIGSEVAPGSAPTRRPGRLLAAAVVAVVALVLAGVIVYLVQRSDDAPSVPAAPAPTSATTTEATTEPEPTSTTTPDGSSAPGGEPEDPLSGADLPVPDPAATAAALQAIAGGPARATEFTGPAIDQTLIQFGQAICLSVTQLHDDGGDAATLSAQLVTTRDQLAESSATIWADPSQASEGYSRVIYYDTKFLCPENLPYADAAFPSLAGT